MRYRRSSKTTTSQEVGASAALHQLPPSLSSAEQEDRILSGINESDYLEEVRERQCHEEALELAFYNISQEEEAVDLARHQELWQEEVEDQRARDWFQLTCTSRRRSRSSSRSSDSSRAAFCRGEYVDGVLEEFYREVVDQEEEQRRVDAQEAGERENQCRLLRQLELDLEVEQVSGQRKRVRTTSPGLESARERTGA